MMLQQGAIEAPLARFGGGSLADSIAAPPAEQSRVTGAVRIEAVTDAARMKIFRDIPAQLYGDDPTWVRPLQVERGRFMEASRNDFFQHARVRFWLAFRGQRPVGRISAQIDERVLQMVEPGLGQWGMFDAEDDDEAARALFSAAEEWLLDCGMRKALGPCNLALNDEPGLLIDGFDAPSSFRTTQTPAYVARLVEAAGYGKARDRLAYALDLSCDFPPRAQRFLDYGESAPFRIRTLDFKALEQEAVLLESAFREIFGDNWGFLPFSIDSFLKRKWLIKLLCRRHWIRIADVDGKAAAIIVTIPNVNEMIADFKGRLLPFNWIKLLYRGLRPRTTWVRVPLFGLHPRFRKSRVGIAITYSLFDLARREAAAAGAKFADLCWIQEDNEQVVKIIEAIGARSHKRYRLYQKNLRGK